MVALTRYGADGTTAVRDTAVRVSGMATKLSQILLDPVQLADKRRRVSAESTSRTVPPVTYPRIAPLPTPLSSSMNDGKVSLNPQISRFPSPDPTPPKLLLGSDTHNKANRNTT